MEYHFETVENVLKVGLEGRLVAACSEEFKDTMMERLKGYKYILFDMEKMAHVDSSGLGALVSILQWINSNGGYLKLANIQPRPWIVFDITKVYRVFDIYDTVEEALDAFRNHNSGVFNRPNI